MRVRLLAAVQHRLDRFIQTQDPAAVLDSEATAQARELLAAVPDPAADLEVAFAVGWLHWFRYQALDAGDDQEDLAAAVRLLAPVYLASPDAVPEQVRGFFEQSAGTGQPPTAAKDGPRTWARDGVRLLRHGRSTGDLASVEGAVRLLRQAVDATSANDEARPRRLSNLAAALLARYSQVGVPADLDAAVEIGRQAVDAAAVDDDHLAAMLSNLGGALRARYERTGAPSDLDAAVDLSRRAADATPLGHPDRAERLSNLSAALQRRFGRTGMPADLDAAVESSSQAVDTAGPDHPDRGAMLANLGTALRSRFERTQVRADLDAAVDAARQAVDATSPARADHAVYLSSLGIALLTRFEQIGVTADLDAALDAGRRSVDAMAMGHPDRPGQLSNVAAALQRRFGHTGALADLDAAIEVGRQAIDAGPPGDPERARYLTNQTSALWTRFGRTGSLADLDAAVDAGRAAVRATPTGHPDWPGRLSNLAAALQRRFGQTGTLSDLDAAVDIGREAVGATLPGHVDRAVMLTNLGGCLRARFERTGLLTDLDTAVTAARAAVDETPAGHTERAGRLSNLAVAHLTRFTRTGTPSDLDSAVEIGRRAVEATPSHHPDRALYLSNLGAALLTRSERAESSPDLDAAAEASRQALDVTPPDHPDRAVYLSNLATALLTRFDRHGEPADLDAVAQAAQEAAGLVVAPPRVRAVAARQWGRSAALRGRWDEAVVGFAAAVELLGELAARESYRADQEDLLAEVGGLGAEAAVCAVRAGDPARAVELFEQGRGVLLAQALDARADLSALRDRQPAMGDRFGTLTAELARPPHAAVPWTADLAAADEVELSARRRRAAREELDRLVADIRELDEFQEFLRPPRLAELVHAAAGGALVLVAVSRYGAYGIVLSGDGLAEPLELAGLTPESVAAQVTSFLTAMDLVGSATNRDERTQARAGVTQTLGWLWDHLTGPVLDQLEILGVLPGAGEAAPPPRVWWCLSGPLSFLPVHAAGWLDTGAGKGQSTALDRVVSSFIPTLRALIHARRRATPGSSPEGGTLAVAMPRTPGASDLPGAKAELAVVVAHLGGDARTLVGEQVQRETVQDALPAATWAHFTCHGYSDLAAPSSSRLLLHDHADRPFSVVEVARLRLEHADLAYLSACSTARPGGRLADEAIHLASAFQLAGYRHVVATLWPVPDRPARRAVDVIYGRLVRDGQRDASRAPDAVHAAAHALRERYPAYPDIWAALIHSGP